MLVLVLVVLNMMALVRASQVTIGIFCSCYKILTAIYKPISQ